MINDIITCDASFDKFILDIKTNDGVSERQFSCNSGSGVFATFFHTKLKIVDYIQECARNNNKTIYNDISPTNSIWLETFTAGEKRGFGPKLLFPFLKKLREYDIKYIALYPSAGLGSDRNKLIEIYKTKYGLDELNRCIWYDSLELMGNELRVHTFDREVEFKYMITTVENMIRVLINSIMLEKLKLNPKSDIEILGNLLKMTEINETTFNVATGGSNSTYKKYM
jgi:hypothetical protein